MPIKPPIYAVLLKSDKVCRKFYDIIVRPFVSSNIPVRDKWNHVLNTSVTSGVWIFYNNLTFRCIYITPVTLKWFQYQIVNTFLSTNVLLHRIGLKDNDLCTFCKKKKRQFYTYSVCALSLNI